MRQWDALLGRNRGGKTAGGGEVTRGNDDDRGGEGASGNRREGEGGESELSPSAKLMVELCVRMNSLEVRGQDRLAYVGVCGE